jgi:hypothetical protein
MSVGYVTHRATGKVIGGRQCAALLGLAGMAVSTSHSLGTSIHVLGYSIAGRATKGADDR